MYAQVIEIGLEAERLELVERLIRHALVPALRQQSGFSGALNLTDRERAETVLVLLWETRGQASRPLASRVARIGPAFASTSELLALRPRSVAVWEVDARG
jgi:hypothetical protein